MKHTIPLLSLAIALSGCTGMIQQKADRYRNIGEKAANPDQVEVRYHRRGDTINFFERRCAGELACGNMTPAPILEEINP